MPLNKNLNKARNKTVRMSLKLRNWKEATRTKEQEGETVQIKKRATSEVNKTDKTFHASQVAFLNHPIL